MSLHTNPSPVVVAIPTALQPKERQKDNTAADGLFYSYPRLCTHVDDNFINQLTDVYRREIPANGAVLDLMSSWVSHLPPEVRKQQQQQLQALAGGVLACYCGCGAGSSRLPYAS